MGAAIDVFDGAPARCASRARASRRSRRRTTCWRCARTPTRLTTTSGWRSRPSGPTAPRSCDLDPRYFKLQRDFDARFADGPPSLLQCERLSVSGDVTFGRDVVVRGEVEIEQDGKGQRRIEDGAVLEG